MKVCVIGAGAAGLCATRHLLAAGLTPVVLEMSSVIGGTWVYTDKIGQDEYGLPVHTSMYKSLRTNLPKEIMGFPDFPILGHEKSYLPAKDILDFIHLYAKHFDIIKHIKFNHVVKLVKPLENGWKIHYQNLKTQENIFEKFDAVMVCNGHYSKPRIPTIKGMSTFKGEIRHSHDYRVPEIVTGNTVLVIGGAGSGLDISTEISSVTRKVLLSHNMKYASHSKFPDNIVQKSYVTEFKGNIAIFEDGTSEDVDTVFLCTGYLYDFSFLDPLCGIRVEDNFVQPLYRQMINIEYPTMCLIGIPYFILAFSTFDLQSQFFTRILAGHIQLPSKIKMFETSETESIERLQKGYAKRQAHMVGPDQTKYYKALADGAGIDTLPHVLTKILASSIMRFLHYQQNYREDVYRIIDDNTYAVRMSESEEVEEIH